MTVSGSLRKRRASKPAEDEVPWEMANLRPDRTGLPFVVWISQRGNARHDVRVNVTPGPAWQPERAASVAVRPAVRVVQGELPAADLALLGRWIARNEPVLIDFWEGRIAYTEDALALIEKP